MRTLACFVALVASMPLFAHPGHGHENSPFHYFTSWDHIAVLVGAMLLIVAAAMVIKSARKPVREEIRD
ncbi:MAG: hypothetical protein KDB07_09285 [Planctomycetes bacterium]|nr:hypothetical protein [Planctomycetota bacterium]